MELATGEMLWLDLLLYNYCEPLCILSSYMTDITIIDGPDSTASVISVKNNHSPLPETCYSEENVMLATIRQLSHIVRWEHATERQQSPNSESKTVRAENRYKCLQKLLYTIISCLLGFSGPIEYPWPES
jgi:hypothetical protein